jgi:hypothetical protein
MERNLFESNYRMNLLLLLLLLRLPNRDRKSASTAQARTPPIKRTPAKMTYAFRSSMLTWSSSGSHSGLSLRRWLLDR